MYWYIPFLQYKCLLLKPRSKITFYCALIGQLTTTCQLFAVISVADPEGVTEGSLQPPSEAKTFHLLLEILEKLDRITRTNLP